ncbi:MAG: hypothetical protein JO362_17205 [Streptomycetaceae bacterium]|nr:hypothetical protein [Streptomycetaceae bacterium]
MRKAGAPERLPWSARRGAYLADAQRQDRWRIGQVISHPLIRTGKPQLICDYADELRRRARPRVTPPPIACSGC